MTINVQGQTVIDEIKNSYAIGDFESVIRKTKNELRTDINIDNQIYYYGMLADVYSVENRLDSALYFVNIAIELDNNVAYLLATRANILTNQNQHKEALNDISDAIRISPENAYYLYHRAVIYPVLKKKKLSKQDFEKVKQIAKRENNQELFASADKQLLDL